MIRQLLKQNTIWLGSSELWLKAIAFICIILIARTFGDTVFGQIAFVFSFLQLFQIIFDFGLAMLMTREISQAREKTTSIVSNFLGLKILLAGILIIVLIIATLFLHKPATILLYIAILSLHTLSMSINELLRSIFRAHERFKIDAVIKLSEGTLLLGLVGLGIATKSILITLTAYSTTALLSTILIIWLLRRNKFTLTISFAYKKIYSIIKQAWPLALAGLFVIVYFRIDTIMLSYLTDDQTTGWYNAAYNFMYTFIVIPGFIMTSFFPQMSRFAKESVPNFRQLYTKSLIGIFIFALILLSILAVSAQWIIPFLYGDAFIPAVRAVQILALGVGLSYVSHVWLFTLTALNKQIIYTWAVGIGMALNIILNAIFIPHYSLYAAAWTTVVTEFITGCIIFVGCHYYVFIKKSHV